MTDPGGASVALGRQISVHTGIYGINAVVTFALGIVNVAVLTRFLSLEQFGELAVLLVFATFVTVVANLTALQGSFQWVFGASGEGGEGGDEHAESTRTASDKRTALTTGLVVTTVVAVMLTGGLVLAGGPVAAAVTGAEASDAFGLAALSGGLGAIWRFAVNVMRYERRPVAFVTLSSLRPIAVLSLTVPLVASGEGVSGALLGTAIGTALATVAALIATGRSYAVGVDRRAVSPIVRRSVFLAPVVVSFWVIQNLDLYVVSLFSPDADVARYRVASRIGAGVSYFASAFLMAWMPLTRTVLQAAVDREHGATGVTATIFTYFAAACLWITLALAVLADGLIRIAPATYEPAAPLIPVLGLGFAAYGGFIVLYRGVRLAAKRRAYVLLAGAAALVFLATAFALVPLVGSYGAAVAPIIGFGAATIVLLFLSQRGPAPIPFDYGVLSRAALIAVVLLGVSQLVAPALEDWRLAVDAAIVVAFPVLLVGAGIVDVGAVRELARGLVRRRRIADDAGRALPEAGSADRRLLDLLADPHSNDLDALARARGMSQEELLGDFVEALRRAAGLQSAGPAPGAVGRYLVLPGRVAERDSQALALIARGVEPRELLELEQLVERVRRRAQAPVEAATQR